MTLYILFQELSAGHIKLTDKMPVSAMGRLGVADQARAQARRDDHRRERHQGDRARSRPTTWRASIAEYIGGSEAGFAKRMTSTAQALGMTHTTYVNASGLPDSRQITTVRDQAILGIGDLRAFPEVLRVLPDPSFSYGKRTYGNHNNLLARTASTASRPATPAPPGYNLMTAARTDGKHIVVVGFGFASAGKRDAKVRDLVETYLPKARSGDYLDAAMIPLPGRKGSPLPADDVQVATGRAGACRCRRRPSARRRHR